MTDEILGGPSPELAAEQRANRSRRRAFSGSPAGKFARGLWRAVGEYLKFRKAGTRQGDAEKGLELVLRETWPFPVSKFSANCDNCDDVGWSLRVCTDAERCGRKFCANRPDYEHTYVEPCFCAAGARHVKDTTKPDDAVVAAGRTRKPKQRGFSQLGQ